MKCCESLQREELIRDQLVEVDTMRSVDEFHQELYQFLVEWFHEVFRDLVKCEIDSFEEDYS